MQLFLSFSGSQAARRSCFSSRSVARLMMMFMKNGGAISLTQSLPQRGAGCLRGVRPRQTAATGHDECCVSVACIASASKPPLLWGRQQKGVTVDTRTYLVPDFCNKIDPEQTFIALILPRNSAANDR